MKNLLIAMIFLLIGYNGIAQVDVGQMAPEISLPNSNDSVINLSSFKNKVLLIDFWASWCGPCRRSIPGVVKLYKKFKDKGFEVFGVSIDANKAEWLAAIDHDKITYTQVNDNTGWHSLIATQYNVNAIPATFLIDKKGKIIAIDAEGGYLKRKIKRALKK
ncbi:MAG TPA: TlpA disulfide reductase family protein [Ferruginibacter sp.]|nr:TlpA disulfide reductase family protein [Ferruginibacter sp.]